jgi:hypothetical protein
MLKGDAFYSFIHPLPSPEGKHYQLSIHDRSAFTIQPYVRDFDPFYYFSDRGETVSSFAVRCAAHFEAGKTGAAVVRRGDKLLLEIGTNEEEHPCYVFDFSRGYNLVSYRYAKKEGYLDDFRYDYQQVAGVFVPSTVVWHRERKDADGIEEKSHFEVRFVKSKINDPVDASQFHLDMLGLRPGDFVYDSRAGLTYEYQGAESWLDDVDVERLFGPGGPPALRAEEKHAVRAKIAAGAHEGKPLAGSVAVAGPRRNPWLWLAAAELVVLVILVLHSLRRAAASRHAQEQP